MKKIACSFTVSLALTVGCSSLTKLEMSANKAPIDESAVTQELTRGSFKRVMVIPPMGVSRASYETVMTLFERELLRRGVKTVSSNMLKDGANPTNFEETLKETRRLGAEAVLQIQEWAWSKDGTPGRFFNIDKDSEGKELFREVTEAEYHSFSGAKYSFNAPQLRFVARLFSAKDGEVLGSFEVRSPANYNLPGNYQASVNTSEAPYKVEVENFGHKSNSWLEESRRKTEVAVITTVCRHFAPGRGVASDAGPAEDAPAFMPSQQ